MPQQKMNLSMFLEMQDICTANGYFDAGFQKTTATFDLYFRRVPDDGGFAIMAGLEQVIDYLENLHFDEHDIAYLKSTNCFCSEFLDYLSNFSFMVCPGGLTGFP